MPFLLTPEFIRNVTKANRFHGNYAETVALAKKITVHADGEIPEALINIRRPNEPEAIKAYRTLIYVPKTKNPVSKVINSLSKIRRSQDWSIEYDSDHVPAIVAKDETLEQYTEFKYPGFTSVTNWAFSELLKRYLLDANSFVAVVPSELPTEATSYMKPVAEVFSSSQIVDYSPGEYIVLLSADTVEFTSAAGQRTYNNGKIFYIITDAQILKIKQTSLKGDMEIVYDYAHNMGEIPAFKVGGIFFKRANNDTIYHSRIFTMVPDLDEAAREYSDLQAEIVQHIHSEKYIYTNMECPVCKGTGMLREKDASGNFLKCTSCNGLGSIKSVSPYGEYIINIGQKGIEQNVPTPPIGYIAKSTEIAKLQDDRVKAHLKDALASINMEFLADTPLSQSGTAKEVDRDELNNFVSSIAEDIVAIMDKIYMFIGEYRYSLIVPDKTKRIAMLPRISVPEKFDMLNSKYLMEEVQMAKTSKVNPVLIKHMEIEYARKKYNSDLNKAYELEAIYDCDPFYGYGQDEKMSMKSNNGITDIDYVISCNIQQFVNQAMSENENFFKLKLSEKKDIIRKYADDVIKLNSTKEVIKKEAFSFSNY